LVRNTFSESPFQRRLPYPQHINMHLDKLVNLSPLIDLPPSPIRTTQPLLIPLLLLIQSVGILRL
jgi:hypothetical protein